jgi:two-component system sensor histidine kinase VicK
MRHPDQRPYTRAELPLVRAMTGEVVRDLDKIIFNTVTGRDVQFRISASPVRDSEGTIVGAVEVASDVTAVVELETLKDEFMQVVAHELKTPVTVVKGFIDLLLRDRPPDMPPDKRRKMLDAIDRGANRLAKIIDDVIDISQLHLGRMAVRSDRVDLEGVVRKVITTAQLETPRHVLRMIGLDRPISIRGDALRIEQIVKALVDNAIAYSPEGGDIEIAAAIRDTQVVVTVTDHGVGIRAERQPRIFERFYRAHTDTPYDRGGLGVSLFIGRQLVRIMGGEMSFESQDGVGSRFSFSLPLWGDQ